MSNTLSEDCSVALFDLDAHHQRASRAAAALALAVSAEEDAQTRATASAEHLEEVEENAGGATTATELIEARAQVELDAATLRAASFRRRSAERTMPNTDTDLADAAAQAVRQSVHRAIPVLSLPDELPQDPDLSDLRPLVTIVQSQPCHCDPRGWLTTAPRRGSGFDQLKPVLLTVYSVEGLPLSLDAESLFDLSGVGLDVTRPEMIRHQTQTYTSSEGDRITKRTFELDVSAAAEEVPLVLVEPEPSRIGHEVSYALRRGFERAGDGSPHVEVGAVSELGTSWTGNVAERGYSVTLSYGSQVGDHSEHNAWIARWLDRLAGQMLDSHGRVVTARVVNGGRPMRDRQLWGAQGVVVEVTTRSRQA